MLIPLFAAVLSAAAPTPASAEHAADKPARSADDKVSCRTTELTGSRLGGDRRCKTKREWDAQDLQQRIDVDRTFGDVNRRGMTAPSTPP